jgi:hypothetical protein
LKLLRERIDRSEARASPSSLLRIVAAIGEAGVHDEKRRRRGDLLDALKRWSSTAGSQPLAGRVLPEDPWPQERDPMPWPLVAPGAGALEGGRGTTLGKKGSGGRPDLGWQFAQGN